MKITRSKHLLFPILAGALLWAQGPVNDVVTVTFPTDVQLGSRVLAAGDYTIRQLTTSSNPRILEFTTAKGTAIQATATAIAALDNNNRRDTSVELETQGGMQHLYRIWLKGKSYGYEFPVVASQITSPSTATSSAGQVRLTATYTPAVEVATVAPQVAENTPQIPAPEPAAQPVPATPNATPVPSASPEPAPVRVAETAPPVADPPPASQTATAGADATLPNTASSIPTLFAAGLGMLLIAGALRSRF